MSMQVATINLVNSVEQEEFEAGLLSESYSVSTKKGKKFKLPAVFDSEVREDLIRQAVHASRANRRQAYGHRRHIGRRRPQPGMKHSVEWHGKGTGVSRIMRKSGSSIGRSSCARSARRA